MPPSREKSLDAGLRARARRAHRGAEGDPGADALLGRERPPAAVRLRQGGTPLPPLRRAPALAGAGGLGAAHLLVPPLPGARDSRRGGQGYRKPRRRVIIAAVSTGASESATELLSRVPLFAELSAEELD